MVVIGAQLVEKHELFREARVAIVEKHQPFREARVTIVEKHQPFREARVTIIEGAQGEGKSVTAVARVVDAYRRDCVRVYCRDVLKMDCDVKSYDKKNKVAKVRHNGELKLVRIPPKYKLHSPMRIFANFHLYGIPYIYLPSFESILEGLESGRIRNGWLVVDEMYVGANARECMTVLGKRLEKRGFQFRKMRLQVILVTPMARLIDWTMRLIPTEHITCACDDKFMVTLTIKKKGQKGIRELTYDGKQYFPNYWTDETVTR